MVGRRYHQNSFGILNSRTRRDAMSEVPVRADDLQALAGLFAPEIIADPYPAYARWRAERPVARPRDRL
jgi:hypothetical protein